MSGLVTSLEGYGESRAPLVAVSTVERAAFGLVPGERVVNGRRMYSAAWIGDARVGLAAAVRSSIERGDANAIRREYRG